MTADAERKAKAVPREPTQNMIDAAWARWEQAERLDLVWMAMYDAAPERPPLPADALRYSFADDEKWARMFHELYEKLAPSFGYATRDETKAFDPLSPNWKLMCAVVGTLMQSALAAAPVSSAETITNGRVDATQGSVEPDIRTVRSAHPTNEADGQSFRSATAAPVERQRDAERYRWIRLAGVDPVISERFVDICESEPETPALFDAAIDAAIQAAKTEGRVRLTTLSPRWITLPTWAAKEPFYVGVSFLCPHCAMGPCPTCGHQQDKRLAVYFWPPIDPDGMMGRVFSALPDNGGHRRVSGETFDTLTLDPSIGFDNPPHFHGYLTAGEITNQYQNAPWAAKTKGGQT